MISKAVADDMISALLLLFIPQPKPISDAIIRLIPKTIASDSLSKLCVCCFISKYTQKEEPPLLLTQPPRLSLVWGCFAARAYREWEINW
jgi:hypothetical protein